MTEYTFREVSVPVCEFDRDNPEHAAVERDISEMIKRRKRELEESLFGFQGRTIEGHVEPTQSLIEGP